MARTSKDCPSCGSRQPCRLTLVPPSGDPVVPAVVTWAVACVTCGHDYAPDSHELVTDAKTWAQERRAAQGGSVLPLEA